MPAGWLAAHLDSGGVMIATTSDDIAREWPIFMAGHPDFVKVFLLGSEHHAERRDDPAWRFKRGIDPALVPELVRRAHAAGLQVSAHVETAADFRVAYRSGVDMIAHLPLGNDDPESAMLTDDDAAEVARRGIPTITTLANLTSHLASDPDATEHAIATVYRPSLARLKAHGAVLLIGSDQFRGTAVAELDMLRKVALFSNLELLRMWSQTTPRSIFPHRKIGELRAGYEASFLVLDGNPLVDFDATKRIALRVEQGAAIR